MKYFPTQFGLLIYLMASATVALGQVVEGTILAGDGEPLPYATVSDLAGATSVETDEFGDFSLATADTVVRVFSALYGDTLVATRAFAGGGTFTFAANQLSVVNVTADSRPDIGHYYLRPVELAAVPPLGGTVDVLRSLQSLPGISGAAEGTAAVGIRGAPPSQTQTLIDGAVVYNPTSFFGFTGAINYAAVRDVNLYVSGVPAKYGGRAAGVLSVATRKGRTDKHRRTLGVGFPTAGFTFDGPLGDRGGSYLFAGRGSYLGAAILVDRTRLLEGDFVGRADFPLGSWTATVATYGNVSNIGGPQQAEQDGSPKTFTGYDNLAGSLTLRRSLGASSLLLRAGRTQYANRFSFRSFATDTDPLSSRERSRNGITSTWLNAELTRALSPRWQIEASLHATYNRYPTESRVQTDSLEQTIEDLRFVTTTHANVVAPAATAHYIEGDVRVDVGLRVSAVFDDRLADRAVLAEPRVALTYAPGERWTYSLHLDRMRQHEHVFNTSALTSTLDQYIAPTAAAPTPVADQVTLGAFREVPTLGLRVSSSVYYKRMRRLLTPRYGNQIIDGNIDDALGNELVPGDGWTAGFEALAAGRVRELEYRVAYAYTRSERTFAAINGGHAFPYRWNRPHSLSVIGTYAPLERWRFGGQFVYETGYAFTTPAATAFTTKLGGQAPTLLFPERNNARTPPHHRLDLSATYTAERPSGQKHEWTASVYNAYARLNPSNVLVEFNSVFERRPDPNDPFGVEPILLGYDAFFMQRSVLRAIPGIYYAYTW